MYLNPSIISRNLNKNLNIFFFICIVIPFSCNFDNDWCDLTFSPDTNDAFRWKRRHGTTSTGVTGPSGDHFTGCE